jgi:hypothetical protein
MHGPLSLRGLLLFLGLECAMLTLQALIGSHWGIFVALTLICFSGVWVFESPDRLKQWRPYMEPYVIPIGLALVIFGAIIIGLGSWRGYGFFSAPPTNPPQAAPQAHPAVDPLFAKIAADLGDKLGPPQSNSGPAALTSGEARRSAQIEFFDRGHVIWIRQKLTFYRLKKDGNKWDARPHSLEVTDLKWWDANYVRRSLKLPNDKNPPDGGVAYEWSLDPPDWSWLGGQVWSCAMDGRKVIYQQFAKGMANGTFPVRYGENEGQIFVLYENGSWDRFAQARAMNRVYKSNGSSSCFGSLASFVSN